MRKGKFRIAWTETKIEKWLTIGSISAFIIVALIGIIMIIYSYGNIVSIEAQVLRELGIALVIAGSLGVSSEQFHHWRTETHLLRITNASVVRILQETYPHLKEVWEVLKDALFRMPIIANSNTASFSLERSSSMILVKENTTIEYENVSPFNTFFPIDIFADATTTPNGKAAISEVNILMRNERGGNVIEYKFDILNKSFTREGKQEAFPDSCYYVSIENNDVKFNYELPKVGPSYTVRVQFKRNWILNNIDDVTVNLRHITKKMSVVINADKAIVCNLGIRNSYKLIGDNFITKLKDDTNSKHWEVNRTFVPYQGVTLSWYTRLSNIR